MTDALPLESSLQYRVDTVRNAVAQAARISGREPESVTLMAVTKTRTCEEIRAVVDAGITVLGENRVQEARDKIPELGIDADWHLIGALQTNKVNHALGLFTTVQSVDRARLAKALSDGISRRIDRGEDTEGRVLDALVEINTSGEESKHGVPPEGALALVEEVAGLPHLRLRGLMTVGLLSENEVAVRGGFARLRALFEEARGRLGTASFDVLSMGMTSDYEWAIAEGSTLVRIGTAIFGPRKR